MAVDKEDFGIAANYAIWGRIRMYTITWIILVSSILAFVLGGIFIFVRYNDKNEKPKVYAAAVFIVFGFI